MDHHHHYSRRNLEDLVVPNYHESSSDSYPSPDLWSGSWNMNTSQQVEKCFDYDVINNGFSGGLYSEMEIGTSNTQEESKISSKANDNNDGCFFSSLHDFDGIQHMDDMFLSSILEEDGNVHSFNESDTNTPGSSSTAYLDIVDGRQAPMFNYNWEACQNIPIMKEDASMTMCEENIDEASAEEFVLQDLQRATEKLTDDTRKCFRDTFYRLAKNSRHMSESGNNNSEKFLENETRMQETELETNSIDRAVANLTFNKMESNMRNLPPQKRISSIQR